eukprot:scaffold845_cov364-Prasinococcus_capsulatus_cf.AAC.16
MVSLTFAFYTLLQLFIEQRGEIIPHTVLAIEILHLAAQKVLIYVLWQSADDRVSNRRHSVSTCSGRRVRSACNIRSEILGQLFDLCTGRSQQPRANHRADKEGTHARHIPGYGESVATLASSKEHPLQVVFRTPLEPDRVLKEQLLP